MERKSTSERPSPEKTPKATKPAPATKQDLQEILDGLAMIARGTSAVNTAVGSVSTKVGEVAKEVTNISERVEKLEETVHDNTTSSEETGGLMKWILGLVIFLIAAILAIAIIYAVSGGGSKPQSSKATPASQRTVNAGASKVILTGSPSGIAQFSEAMEQGVKLTVDGEEIAPPTTIKVGLK